MFDITVIGGGAHGVLAALRIFKTHPQLRIALFEKRKQLLVNYRAEERFRIHDKIYLKEQILEQVRNSGIQIFKSSAVESIKMPQSPIRGNTPFELKTRRGTYPSTKLIVACGPETSFLELLGSMGLEIRAIRPGAFKLECNDRRLKGVRIQQLEVSLSWMKPGPPRRRIRIQLASALPEIQPLKRVDGSISLHAGRLSGKAVLELTRHMLDAEEKPADRIRICVNWLPEYGFQGLLEYLQTVGRSEGKKTVMRSKIFPLPGSLWRNLVAAADITKSARWEELSYEQYFDFTSQLHDSQFHMKPDLSENGVLYRTGGLSLRNLKLDRPESLAFPGMFFIGTILDQDQQFPNNSFLELTDRANSWLSEIGGVS